MFRSEQGYFLRFWISAGARQAICQGHGVRHSYMGSEPGLQVPRVLASCDFVMRASGSEGGPYSEWNIIPAISAVSTGPTLSLSFYLVLLCCESSACENNFLFPAPAVEHSSYTIVSFSYPNGCSNNNTISFGTIKVLFFFLRKKSYHIACQSF